MKHRWTEIHKLSPLEYHKFHFSIAKFFKPTMNFVSR